MKTLYLSQRVALDKATHALIKAIAREEGRTAYGVVKSAINLYDNWRKQAEDVIDNMELVPRKRK